MGRCVSGFSVLASLLLAVTAAHAEVDDASRAAARTLGSAGVQAYQANDFQAANDKLGRAYEVLHAPSLGLWSARAMVKVGKLVEAAQRYLDVTRLQVATGDAAVQKQAQADAQKELAELTPRLPSLVVNVSGADRATVTITIDDVPLSSALVGESRPANPGEHRVHGVRGEDKADASVTVAEGEQKSITLSFAAGAAASPAALMSQPPTTDAAPRSSAGRTLGWVALGAGGAAVIVGAVAGVVVLGKKSTLESDLQCSGTRCLHSEESTVSGYNSWRTVSTLGFVAGGVLAGTGVVLLLTSPKATERVALQRPGAIRVALKVGFGSASLDGSF